MHIYLTPARKRALRLFADYYAALYWLLSNPF